MDDPFVNRKPELDALERWWETSGRAAIIWGRRRVGKTLLLQVFSKEKQAVYHTGAGRTEAGELAVLSNVVGELPALGLRNLATRPYSNWDDAFDDLASRAIDQPLLVVLDEFPELVKSSPQLPGILRAFLDRTRNKSQIRLLLCGSAVRHMQAMQEQREPLYGRFDLSLCIHPFSPHEAAAMLPVLSPAERAIVYGIVGGMPLYLSWWDQTSSVRNNLARLVCEPGARLMTEGDLVLRTDIDGGEFASQVLYAIASGRTQHSDIKDVIKTEPMRTLERLIELRLVERVQPVGESERTKRRLYRIVDPFIRFHLGVVSRYRSQIERGLGGSILPVLEQEIDDHMGDIWEEAFRDHLRQLAVTQQLPIAEPVVAIGPWWDTKGDNEIDALILAGRSATPVMAGEAKWAKKEDARQLVTALRRKVANGLHLDADLLRYVVCARTSLTNVPKGVVALTAKDLFS